MNRKEKRVKKKELNILQEVINVIYQYFPELINKFEGLTDLRNQSYVTYQMKLIFMVRLMGLICEIKTMNELTRELNTEEAIENIAQICGLELDEIPHCDTINDVFKNIKVEEIEKIRKYMVVRLIRSKMLDKYKIRNRYYHIVVDGTGLDYKEEKVNIIKHTDKEKGTEYVYMTDLSIRTKI